MNETTPEASAPEPAKLNASLVGGYGSTVPAVYLSGTSTTVLRWPASGIANRDGSPAAGQPCSTAYLWAGAVGNVTETHTILGRNFGGTGGRPASKPVPSNLHWDEWLGPAPFREYHDNLHPFAWRSWRHFTCKRSHETVIAFGDGIPRDMLQRVRPPGLAFLPPLLLIRPRVLQNRLGDRGAGRGPWISRSRKRREVCKYGLAP